MSAPAVPHGSAWGLRRDTEEQLLMRQPVRGDQLSRRGRAGGSQLLWGGVSSTRKSHTAQCPGEEVSVTSAV